MKGSATRTENYRGDVIYQSEGYNHMRFLSVLPLTVKLPVAITVLVITGVIVSNVLEAFLDENMSGSFLFMIELALPSAIAALVGFVIAGGISRPLVGIADTLKEIGKRSYDSDFPAAWRGDEIARIAKALISCRDQLASDDAAIKEKTRLIEAIGHSQGMIEFGPTGNIIRANKAFLDIVGYTEAEVIGSHNSMFGPKDFAQSNEYRRMWSQIAQGEMWGQIAQGEPLTGTFTREAKDGRTIYFQESYSPVRDDDGRVVCVVMLALDVTEAETARRAAERESNVQASLIEGLGASQAMIDFDASGKILGANAAFEEVMGYAAGEIVGCSHTIFVEPSYAGSAEYRTMWEKLITGQPLVDIFQCVAKDGRIVYLQGTYIPVRGAAGDVVKVVKVATDITDVETERLVLEEQAFEQRASIAAISDSHTTVEFDAKGKILKANENFLDLMGYSEAEIFGRTQATLSNDDVAQTSEYRDMWHALEQGEAVTGTFEWITKGRRTVWLQGSYTPVRGRDGNVQRVVKMASNITATESERVEAIAKRKAMETELNEVVEELNGALSNLASGDLSVRIVEQFAAGYEDLRKNFNAAIEQLETTISSVVVAASNIRNESNQVATAADHLAERTENQAAALEQTAAALEELTTSVKATAESAETASTGVAGTKTAAVESGYVVKKAVKAMSKIEKSSEKISQIIGVIEDIAFQTNLLALNAGVEAARAGDAGRGFAVVASEVQALATRSSDAAKEIKALISTSSQQVETGVELVAETGKALAAIVESVTAITSLVDGIASSAREQSVGINEINLAVGQLDQVTQQNAAMVEEANAASHTMRSEAESLSELVSQFSVKGATGLSPADRIRMPINGPKGNVTRIRAKTTVPSHLHHANGKVALANGSEHLVNNWEEF
jgi:methyl-accepting chemotaxis protein